MIPRQNKFDNGGTSFNFRALLQSLFYSIFCILSSLSLSLSLSKNRKKRDRREAGNKEEERWLRGGGGEKKIDNGLITGAQVDDVNYFQPEKCHGRLTDSRDGQGTHAYTRV